MLSTAVNVALAAAAIYFFYQRNYAAGVILLIVTVARMYQYKLQQFGKGVAQLTKYSDFEKNSNCFLQLTIDIDGVLKHESVLALFEKLQSTGRINREITRDQWADQLRENYRQKYGTDNGNHEAKFNIKNNLLWRNGQIDFLDSIYHELFIPYDPQAGSRKITTPLGENEFDRKLETH